jgi:hypothetical protein
MKRDVKSNFSLVESLAAVSRNTGDANSTSVDMSTAESASFLISVGSVGAAGTLAAKLQHSADGSTGWTDEVAGAGNDTAITTITAAGSATLHVVNPRRRYYRVATTVGANAVVFGVAGVAGPLKSVVPA